MHDVIASTGAGAAVLIVLVWIVGVLFGLALYMLPTIIAGSRHHRQTVAIGVLNFFLGWTFLGWLGALVWSLTNPAPGVTVVNQWSPQTTYGYGPPPASGWASAPPASGPPPGWYPDPTTGRQRWWSGAAWTENYQ